jgi:hypothetical protein
MPFNWNDPTQPPFNNEIMTLTHEECVKVKEGLKAAEDGYEQSYDYPEISQTYIINTYNRANLYEPINGSTYTVLEAYDPEVNKLGIDGNGIVPEPEPEEEETQEPGEEPTEETPDSETAPVNEEEVTEEA